MHRITRRFLALLGLLVAMAAAAEHQTQGLDPAEPGLPIFHERLRQQLRPSLGWQLDTRLWPQGHVFPAEQQEAAFDWLDRQLSFRP